MASVVDICNIALSRIGDTAIVTSIDPPEGSVQAQHCARFYPLARNFVLEKHSWNFNTKRVKLSNLRKSWSEWKYVYSAPSDMLSAISVLPPDAEDDYSSPQPLYKDISIGQYYPQPYAIEYDESNGKIIYTNQENAVLRYNTLVTDTSLYSSMAIEAITWLLASYIAGPIIKGDQGAKESKVCLQMFTAMMTQAITQDSMQRKIDVNETVNWITSR